MTTNTKTPAPGVKGLKASLKAGGGMGSLDAAITHQPGMCLHCEAGYSPIFHAGKMVHVLQRGHRTNIITRWEPCGRPMAPQA